MNFETHLLVSKHRKSAFACENSSLTTYLKEQAGQDIKRKLALCFVSLDTHNNVTGYYTLSNASIPKNILPEDIRKKFGYKDLPVTLIGRLARDITLKGTGHGELLLLDALWRSHQVARVQIASFAVVTDPIDDIAEKFYSKYNFTKLEGSNRMFLPMKTVEMLFL